MQLHRLQHIDVNINYIANPMIIIINVDVKLQIYRSLSSIFHLDMVVLEMDCSWIFHFNAFFSLQYGKFVQLMINRSLENYKPSRYTTFQNLFCALRFMTFQCISPISKKNLAEHPFRNRDFGQHYIWQTESE